MTDIRVLDKAASILALLEVQPRGGPEILTLLGLSRSTGYRLLKALEEHRFVERGVDGLYRLGGFPGGGVGTVGAVLEALRDATGESVQLWLLTHPTRTCVCAVDSRQTLRISKSAGEVLDLADGGSAALAFQGSMNPEELYVTCEGRDVGSASTSTAFELADGTRLAVCVSYPVTRVPRDVDAAFRAPLVAAAQQLRRRLPDAYSLGEWRSRN